MRAKVRCLRYAEGRPELAPETAFGLAARREGVTALIYSRTGESASTGRTGGQGGPYVVYCSVTAPLRRLC